MQRTLKRECKVLEIAKREAAGPSTCLRSAWASQYRFVLSDIDRGEVQRLCFGGCRAAIPGACAAALTEAQRGQPQMLTKWTSPTRLETRTKESNVYASTRVANPCAK